MSGALAVMMMLGVGASAGSAANDAEAPVRLYAFDCGSMTIVDMRIFVPEGDLPSESGAAADGCFLIRHPKGDLMWDTGMPDSVHDGIQGPYEPELFAYDLKRKLVDQLRDIGVVPEEVEYITLSHAHWDHAGNVGLFSNARWIVQADEKAFMFSNEMRSQTDVYATYKILEDADPIVFRNDYDVFGDGTVILFHTPGHTPGHSSMLVRLENSGPVVVTGDLYHSRLARSLQSVPVYNNDKERTRQSMLKLEALVEAEGARVIIPHAMEDAAELPVPPAYLD